MRFFWIFLLSLHMLYGEERGKILICGVCKNVENSLPSVIHAMTLSGEAYDDYRIIIYENNSSDSTAKILRNWQKQNEKVILFTENLTLMELKSHCPSGIIHREEILAMARNRILSEIMKVDYNDFDFVLMADMDFKTPWDVEALIETTSRTDIEWDGVFSNGLIGSDSFYDHYAYRSSKHPIGPECLGDWWWKHSRDFHLPSDGEWEPVYSAFNGMGIYKREALKGASYSGTVNQEVEKAMKLWIDQGASDHNPYVETYYSLIKNWPCYFASSVTNPKKRKQLPESFGLIFDDSPTQIVWHCGKGAKLPHICEHIALHASMANRGHGKLFINPKLESHYSEEKKRGKILICGVCQNVADKLSITIKNMINCGNAYDDYHIIIYENNSIDATSKLLHLLGASNPKTTIISEKLSQEKIDQKKGRIGRMELIADARNRVLNIALSKQYDDFDFLIMADMDFDQIWDIDEIVKTTSRRDIEWDGVFANGIVATKRDHYKNAPRGAFYDLYAYRSEDHPLCIESLGTLWWDHLRWLVLPPDAPWEPVYSAFNGMGIYKREALKGSKYSGTVTLDLEIAVKRWMETAKECRHPYIDLYEERKGYVIPGSLSWFNPRGAPFLPEVCEHVVLHASMANKGHGKFFINPKLLTYYYG